MRVLQINAVYGKGSTGTIIRDIHEHLKDVGIESYVFSGTICCETTDYHVNRIGNTFDHKLHAFFRRFSHKHGGHSVLATKRLCKKIEKISPDVVHLHNLHNNYLNLKVLSDYLIAKKIPVVLTLHDCWFFTGYCMSYLYYGGCTLWQNGCKNCHALKGRKSEIFLREKETLFNSLKTYAAVGVSEWLAKDVERSVLNSADIIEYVYNWVNTDVFRPREIKTDYRRLFGIDERKKIILGVAQGWSEVKGLNDFVYLAKGLETVADIILVGGHQKGEYPENLHFIDYIGDREKLSGLYGFADLVVNPSRAEAFGLVTVEAMACGTPVVGYANTGTKELIKENYGKTVADGDREELLVAVKQMLGEPKSKYSTECRNYIVKEFSKKTQIEKYVKIYKKLIDLDHAKK